MFLRQCCLLQKKKEYICDFLLSYLNSDNKDIHYCMSFLLFCQRTIRHFVQFDVHLVLFSYTGEQLNVLQICGDIYNM